MNAYELVNKIRGDFFSHLIRKRRYSKEEIQLIFNASALKVTLRELNEITSADQDVSKLHEDKLL